MSEASLLRALADSLDELEALKLFPAEVTDPGTVTVEWTASSDHPGYAVLSQAISAMVEQHWNALRSQVVKKKESEVAATRKEWSEIAAAPVAPEAPVADSLSAAMAPSRVQLVQRQA
jgi:hypothetical protein